MVWSKSDFQVTNVNTDMLFDAVETVVVVAQISKAAKRSFGSKESFLKV